MCKISGGGREAGQEQNSTKKICFHSSAGKQYFVHGLKQYNWIFKFVGEIKFTAILLKIITYFALFKTADIKELILMFLFA